MVQVALDLFVERGFEGTSVGDIAAAMGVSKAAVSYHFPTKDDLLAELAEGPLAALEVLVADAADRRGEPGAVRDLLAGYVDVLLVDGDVAAWLDTDHGVLHHPVLGPRVADLHRATRAVLGGGDDGAGDLAASAALGVVWRPVRNLDLDLADQRVLLVEAALAVLAVVDP